MDYGFLSTTPNIVSPPLHSGTSNSNNGNGMWNVVAGLGSGILSGLGSLFGQKSANKANKELAQEQMQWQSEENQKAFDRNVQMFNMENAYNDPSQVMNRLRNAGVNPHLAFANGGVASAMSQSASGNVTPGGVSPVMATQQPVNYGAPFAGVMEGLTQMANVQKSIADAKKAGAETWQIELLANENLRGMVAGRKLHEWELYINQKYGDRKASEEVRKLTNECNKIGQDFANAIAEGDLITAKKNLTDMEKTLKDYEGKIKKKEYDTWDETYNLWKSLQNEYIKTEQTQQDSNKASANQSNTQAGVNVAEQKLKKQSYDFLQKANEKELAKLDTEIQAGNIENACKIVSTMFTANGIGAPPMQELLRHYVENKSDLGMSASEFVQDIFKNFNIHVPADFVEKRNKDKGKPKIPYRPSNVPQFPGMRW